MPFNAIKYAAMIKTSMFWLLLLIAQFTVAQQNPILGHFSVSEGNGKVFMSWQIIAGSTCNGIQIYRSIDSLHFIEIGDIPGIYGNITTAQDYDFIDYEPEINKINYYRLQLGNNGFSEIIAVEIIRLEIGGYQIRPNPVSTVAKIYFNNIKKEPHQFVLYNLKGILVTNLSSNEDFFDFNANNLDSGLYFFSISNANNLVKAKGKMIIQR